MSTTTETNPYQADADPAIYEQYKSISPLAVTAVVIGIFSGVAILSSTMLVVALIGIGVGIWATISVKRNLATQTGFPIAVLGIVLSSASLVVGSGIYVWDEYLSIPEGYESVAFGLLQEQPGQAQGQPVPDTALDLNGKQILLRGYVYPHSQKSGLTRFVLVPDFDTCCFGGQPKLTDMVEVKLQEPLTVDFSFNRRKVGGVLSVSTDMKQIEDLTGVYYELDADFVD